MKKLVIKNRDLKAVLRLFPTAEPLQITELGDTLHPASGFVDESYFSNIHTVDDLLKIDYDFNGLVVFSATVQNIDIAYEASSEEFILTGDAAALQRMQNQLHVLMLSQSRESC